MDNWLSACRGTSRGQLFLDNLGIDLSAKALEVDALHEFAGGVRGFNPAVAPAPRPGDEPYVMLTVEVISDRNLFLRGPATDQHRDGLAVVTRVDAFTSALWFDLSYAGGLGENGASEDVLETLESVGDYAHVLKAGATLRTGLPMVWLLRRGELDGVVPIYPQETAADIARDQLGLLNYAADHFLCRLDISEADVSADALRRPTGFDGGIGLVFRSNLAPEKCGRTIDIRTGVASMTEFVHPPIPFRAKHKFVPLGRISYLPEFSWASLARTADPARVDKVANILKSAPHAV